MTIRRLVSLLLNITAVFLPTGVLYARFGTDKVDSANPDYLLPIVLAMAAAFLIGSLSGRILTSTEEGMHQFFSSLHHTRRDRAPGLR